jgi:hypothetical protein
VTEHDPVRVASSHLFGQVCKLEVIALIANEPTGIFHHGDLISQSSRVDSASGYHKALSDLVAAGLLEKLPRNGHRQPYRRKEYAIWQWAADYVSALRGDGADRRLQAVPNGVRVGMRTLMIPAGNVSGFAER